MNDFYWTYCGRGFDSHRLHHFNIMKHLEKENISYIEHYFRALKFALWCGKMYFVCIIHGVFPFLFEDTFSIEIKRMANRLEEEKNNAQRR